MLHGFFVLLYAGSKQPLRTQTPRLNLCAACSQEEAGASQSGASGGYKALCRGLTLGAHAPGRSGNAPEVRAGLPRSVEGIDVAVA